MNNRLKPTFFENSFYSLDFDKIANKGYLYLFVDLDNTLASPYVYNPDESLKSLLADIKDKGIEVIVISNNHEDRVCLFCKDLDVRYIYECKKPNHKKIDNYINDNNMDRSKILFIGDQVMTDVNVANKLGVDVCLLNPLTKKDEPITFFPRLLDKHYKRIILKKHYYRRINDD